jgi:hypothetical protein
MAIVVRFEVSGMSSDKYEEVHRRLDAAGQGSPAGRLYHASYGSPDNLQVIDVWESPESLAAFGGSLQPILGELGIDAVPRVEPAYRIIES